MEYFCCVLRRHLIKKFKDVNANALFNSFLMGSQFIFKNSFVPMWALLSRFKQYLMHLFWAICILFDCRLFSKGYYAAQAWSKCGVAAAVDVKTKWRMFRGKGK